MKRKMTAKQIKYFGTKAQRRSLSTKRKSKVKPTMARRRSYRRTAIRRVGRRVSRAFSPTKAIMGGAGYAVLMPLVASKLPILNQPLIRMAGGYMLAKKSGIVGDIGKAALYIEIANIASGFASGGLSGVSEAVIS